MGDFRKATIRTFGEELQALIDYGHDCCARIDDRIHECCQRIREAHDVEVGSYQTALTWTYAAMLPQYDVLGNERHKALCKLREMPDGYPEYSAFPFAKWSKDLSIALDIDEDEVSCAKVRDRLIHLLGGDLKGSKDGMDAGGCVESGAGSGVHAAAGRVCDCAGDQLAEGVAPITQELRDYLSEADDNLADDWLFVNVEWSEVNRLCDAIDAVHKSLERENKELRQRTKYPAESERINVLEREVKRLTAECKTQRNNFDQATYAREHWESLYEQSLEQIHDLKHDVEMWRDRAEDMRMERDDALKEHHAWAPESHYMMLPKDAEGEPIHIGDVMEWCDGSHEPFKVVGIGDNGVLFYDYGTTSASDKRHYHEPTVKDVLWGLLGDIRPDMEDEEAVPIVAAYAKRLRLAGDAS